MKRTVLFALMITLLLSGCGAGERDERTVSAWREELRTAKSVTLSAEITAQSGKETLQYGADCVWEGGATALTLTAPELIAGVTFRSDDGGTTLEYDGAELRLGDIASGGMSPCAALPVFMKALTDGRLLRTRRESGCLVAELSVSETVCVSVWLGEDGLAPQCAEIAEDGYTSVCLKIHQWNREAGTT